MTVCKFGGSSVASTAQLKKVKDIILADKERRIVVVSAPGKRSKEDTKVTDLLYACNAIAQQNLSCRNKFKEVAERYLEIAAGFGVDDAELKTVLDEVRFNIDAGRGTDYSASRGEYLSAYLFAKIMGWEFIDTADVIVIGQDGTVDPSTYEKIAARVKKNGHYVVPGFYGATSDGQVKTFSRGGSDITGSIFAGAVGADLYENWTDVSGILAADPRIIENPRGIKELTYRQVRELSDVGASVFHEEAIAPVVKKEIPIRIKNTNRPEDEGTLIVPSSDNKALVGVSGKGGLSTLRVSKLMLFKKYGVRHAMLTMMHIFGVRPSYSLYGIDTIVWFFDSKLASESVAKAMCERLKKEFELDECAVETGHAVLGLVGDMENGTGYLDAAQALKEAGIKSSINVGASEVTSLFYVKEEDLKPAIKAVYDRCFR
jgi:Aspartokinases